MHARERRSETWSSGLSPGPEPALPRPKVYPRPEPRSDARDPGRPPAPGPGRDRPLHAAGGEGPGALPRRIRERLRDRRRLEPRRPLLPGRDPRQRRQPARRPLRRRHGPRDGPRRARLPGDRLAPPHLGQLGAGRARRLAAQGALGPGAQPGGGAEIRRARTAAHAAAGPRPRAGAVPALLRGGALRREEGRAGNAPGRGAANAGRGAFREGPRPRGPLVGRGPGARVRRLGGPSTVDEPIRAAGRLPPPFATWARRRCPGRPPTRAEAVILPDAAEASV